MQAEFEDIALESHLRSNLDTVANLEEVIEQAHLQE